MLLASRTDRTVHRRGTIATLALLALLLLPPAAGAATFYVDDDAGSSTTCTSPEQACNTIQEGVNAAKGAGADTVAIAAGVYTEQVSLDDALSNGTTLDGAGPSSTTVELTPDVGATGISIGFNATVSDVTVRDLRVLVPTEAEDATAIGLRARYAERLRVIDVRVEGEPSSSDNARVLLENANATLDGVVVEKTEGFEAAVVVSPDVSETWRVSIWRSELVGGGGDFGHALRVQPVAGDPIVNVHTSVLRKASGGNGAPVQVLDANLMLDSTLVRGANDGIDFRSLDGFQHVANLLHATIDATNRSLVISSSGAGNASVGVSESLLLRPPAAFGGSSDIDCNNSDVPDAAPPGGSEDVNCDSGTNGNTSSSRAELFDADYRLKPGSPAVDAGNSTVYFQHPTENPHGWESGSTTDLAGAPRLIDGTKDCLAFTDRGAYELQGQAGARPQPSIAAPDVVAPGEPVTFTGSAAPAGQPNSFAWSFSDGHTASGPTATRAFAAAEPQTATLTVTGPGACGSATTSRTVDVRSPVVAPGDVPAPAAVAAVAAEPALPVLDTVPPRLSSVSLTRRSFRTRGRRVGTNFRFSLSEPATVTIRIQRLGPGRRIGRRCSTPSRANRRGSPCTRSVSVGVLSVNARQGPTTTRWRGRVAGRRVRAGRYRAVLVAMDGAGLRSAPAALRFRIRR